MCIGMWKTCRAGGWGRTGYKGGFSRKHWLEGRSFRGASGIHSAQGSLVRDAKGKVLCNVNSNHNGRSTELDTSIVHIKWHFLWFLYYNGADVVW